MRWFAILALMLVAPSQALVISEIHPDPEAGQREFIELHNDGPGTVDLAGWYIEDTAGNTYTFQNQTLGANARLVVWGGGSADLRGPAWSKATVWNNAGDQAYLYNATGALVDAMAYGSASPIQNETVPAAPDKGYSLALRSGAWVELRPTPGTQAQAQQGSVQASVADVAPTITLTAPAEVEPGAAFQVTVAATDGNGDAVSWDVHGDGQWLAQGNHSATINLTAPTDRDAFQLQATVRDPAGNENTTSLSLAIVQRGLVVAMPSQGVQLHMVPGAEQVIADHAIQMTNHAATQLVPRIDASDFSGPQTIPVESHLWIGIGASGNQTWVQYTGPLTQLPAIAAGEDTQLWFRMDDVPSPLPAGDYGTSFTVIA